MVTVIVRNVYRNPEKEIYHFAVWQSLHIQIYVDFC